MAEHEYTLNYFNAKGRGELIRYLFAVADQPYVDKRIEKDDWPKQKELTPFGKLPTLEIKSSGKQIAQSQAILRFLARKFKLAGKNESEEGEVDMCAEQVAEIQDDMFKIYMESDATKKAELLSKFEADLPKLLGTLENRLKKRRPESSKPGADRPTSANITYLVGSSLTYVDLYLFRLLELLDDKKSQVLASFPALKLLDEKIGKLPKLAEWRAKRPVTEH